MKEHQRQERNQDITEETKKMHLGDWRGNREGNMRQEMKLQMY